MECTSAVNMFGALWCVWAGHKFQLTRFRVHRVGWYFGSKFKHVWVGFFVIWHLGAENQDNTGALLLYSPDSGNSSKDCYGMYTLFMSLSRYPLQWISCIHHRHVLYIKMCCTMPYLICLQETMHQMISAPLPQKVRPTLKKWGKRWFQLSFKNNLLEWSVSNTEVECYGI